MTETNHTAILIFTRLTHIEATKKKLRHGGEQNRRFHKLLQEQTLLTAKRTSLPVFCITESDQEGDSFGERLANAFRTIFYKGYYNVISIGTDCPDLTFEDLLISQQKLETGGAVIGPDHRGGAYLIGLSRDMFKSDAFERLSWQTGQLLDDLEQYFQSIEGSFTSLVKKGDLNSLNDVEVLASYSETLRLLLTRLQNQSINSFEIDLASLTPKPGHGRRGPPLY